jgi:tetratricopeptide (TPR) repeat protein
MRRSYERAAAIWEGLARHWTYAYAPFALGQLNLVTGHWPEGTRLLEEAVKHSTKGRNLHIQRKAQHELAEAELLMGRAQPAWLRLDPLVAVAGQEEEVDVIPLLPLIAWADLELEQSAPARALLEEAAERAHLQHHQLAMLDVLRVRAMLHLREEQWPAAEESLVQALASCRAMPYPYAEAKLLYCYGQMHAAKGEPERARERFEAALAICARLGEGLYRPHIEHALAAIEGR